MFNIFLVEQSLLKLPNVHASITFSKLNYFAQASYECIPVIQRKSGSYLKKNWFLLKEKTNSCSKEAEQKQFVFEFHKAMAVTYRKGLLQINRKKATREEHLLILKWSRLALKYNLLTSTQYKFVSTCKVWNKIFCHWKWNCIWHVNWEDSSREYFIMEKVGSVLRENHKSSKEIIYL